jgi:FtsZ family protein
MKRRKFLKTTSLTLAGSAFPCLSLFSFPKSDSPPKKTQAISNEDNDMVFATIGPIIEDGGYFSYSCFPKICLAGIGKKGADTVHQIVNYAKSNYTIRGKTPDTTICFIKVHNDGQFRCDDIETTLDDTDVLFGIISIADEMAARLTNTILSIADNKDILTIGAVSFSGEYNLSENPYLQKASIDSFSKMMRVLFINSVNSYGKSLESTNIVPVSEPEFRIINALIDLISSQGIIGLDLSDFKTTIENGNRLCFGIGNGKGKNGPLLAAKEAISSMLCSDESLNQAASVIIHIKASESFTLLEAQDAAEFIQNKVSEKADVIFGLHDYGNAEGECEILVITNHYHA